MAPNPTEPQTENKDQDPTYVDLFDMNFMTLTPEKRKLVNELHSRFKELISFINSHAPNNREKSLARTNLEQAKFWMTRSCVTNTLEPLFEGEDKKVSTIKTRTPIFRKMMINGRKVMAELDVDLVDLSDEISGPAYGISYSALVKLANMIGHPRVHVLFTYNSESAKAAEASGKDSVRWNIELGGFSLKPGEIVELAEEDFIIVNVYEGSKK